MMFDDALFKIYAHQLEGLNDIFVTNQNPQENKYEFEI